MTAVPMGVREAPQVAETEPTATRRRLRPLPARAWMDVVVLTVLAVIAILGFAPAFTDSAYLVAGLGGLLVGTVAGLIAAVLRLGILTTAAVATFAYFLFGSALAMPALSTAGILPTLATLAGLVNGAVYGWADIVTLASPVAAPDYIGVLPYLCGLLVGLASASLAGRWYAVRPRTALASSLGLIAPSAVYVASVLTGTAQPYYAAPRGVAFAAIAVVWMAWRVSDVGGATAAARAAAMRRRLIGVLAIVAVAVAGGTGLGIVTAPSADERFVLREEIQPPFDPREFPSPLSGFRRYTNDLTDDVLFRVDGVAPGTLLRIATMDTYNGKLWTVSGAEQGLEGSGSFRLVSGDELRMPEPASPGPSATVRVTIEGYRDVWMPSTGYPQSVEVTAPADLPSTALRYNDATGVLVDTTVVNEGDGYEIRTLLTEIDEDSLSGRAVAQVPLPPVEHVPDQVSARAVEWTSAFDTPIEKLREIEARFRDDGFLSHGSSTGEPSRAGHGADRMLLLLGSDYMVGDGEQYAAAFALMARSLGYPARVVMGFRVPEGVAPQVVTGDDVTAWAEVAFDGIGWVVFDPTPENSDVPQDEQPKPQSEPQPQVPQPPRPETDQEDLVSPVEIEEEETEPPFAIPAWVGSVAAAIGIPLALYLLPVLLIAAVKRRRRARRRSAPAADRRAAGAWEEVVDLYAELGYRAPRRSTRVQLALSFEQQFLEELEARRREQQDAAGRAEGRRLRAEAISESKRRRASGESGSASPRTDAAHDTGRARAVEVGRWRPGIVTEDDPLPVLPGLREFAVQTDASAFSGAEVSEDEIERLWAESEAAALAARRSVSWFRRQLSRFRIRPQRDIVAELSGRLSAAVPRRIGGLTR